MACRSSDSNSWPTGDLLLFLQFNLFLSSFNKLPNVLSGNLFLRNTGCIFWVGHGRRLLVYRALILDLKVAEVIVSELWSNEVT